MFTRYCSIALFGHEKCFLVKYIHIPLHTSYFIPFSIRIDLKNAYIAYIGFSKCFHTGGGLTAVFGIVTALLERERSGQGQVIDANLVSPINC